MTRYGARLVRRLLAIAGVATAMLIAARAQAVVVAHWPFEPADLTIDASGNGNTLMNVGATVGDASPAAGSTGSASFDTTGWLQTLAPLDLTPYDMVRISWWQHIPAPVFAVTWEHSSNYNLNDHGLIATVREVSSGVGRIGQQVGSEPGERKYNLKQYEHGFGASWRQLAVEYDHLAAVEDMVRVFVDGVRVDVADPDFTLEPQFAFTNDVFHIGARGGGQLGLFGSLDDMMIEGFIGTPTQPGDFDGDGDVDGADFVAWQTNFPTASGATLEMGDADGDGDVDGADFVVWQTNFPFTPGSSVISIPEPSEFILIITGLGGFALLLARLRRLSYPCLKK